MPIPAAFNRTARTVRNQTARMTRKQKLSASVMAVVGASVLAGAVAPGVAQAAPAPHSAVATTRTASQQAHSAVLKGGSAKKAAHTAGGHGADKSIAFKTAAKTMPAQNNLDGWIHQALAIMHKHHIAGSFEGIKRNALRESSGNPHAINNWDINAQNGVPSKGLLQVIPPTFATYHVAGTSKNIYDPVANIVAACNYAEHRYGSMDNVDSAY
ncbi:transglycosylase SLT domain-containing protein [Streptomyces sp. SL54]|uniref:Transglycosylase SLT domain-containing protein n=2 Tax=Streptantibioticus silvisoli TaxID=2705255 RepID=A0ABT6W2J4_9ACTN|nr:transglycosylase SLT domain-containing protein [Streptantibioticus silvisoli]